MQDIIIASDHRGFELKQSVKNYLREKKLFFVDVGVESADKPNNEALMPPIIKVVKEAMDCVKGTKHMCGILICGNGIGMSIAANRFKGIRAALCRTVDDAKQARQHNDCNVLCLGGDITNLEDAKKIINTFVNTKPLEETRYRRRQALLDTLS